MLLVLTTSLSVHVILYRKLGGLYILQIYLNIAYSRV